MTAELAEPTVLREAPATLNVNGEAVSPIRIAYVVHDLDVGGIQRCVANLANGLDRERFAPCIFSMTNAGPASQWLRNREIPVESVQKRDGNDLSAVFRLSKLLKGAQVQVVHSHNWGTLLETAIARRLSGVRCHIHSEHGQGLHHGIEGWKRILRRRATHWAFNRATAVLVCAESVRPEVASRSGFPDSEIWFEPNGVVDPLQNTSCEDSATLRRRWSIPADAIVVGSVGRIVDVKDFPTAVRAIKQLGEGHRPVHLVLVGDGPGRQLLENQIRDLGLTARIHLVGWHAEVTDWLQLFDIYVNCSLSEAMSLGILEAMGTGTPIVATDVGDNRSVVLGGQDPCGIIVPPRCPDELAEAIRSLIESSPEQERMRASARARFVSEYSLARMIQRHQDLYEKSLSDSSKRRQVTA